MALLKTQFLKSLLFSLTLLSTSGMVWGATDLRVVTWNIGVNGTGTDGRQDIDRVYNMLRAKAADADIITCNECYSDTITDFTSRLTRDTGVTWHSTTHFDAGSHNHSGILSRYAFASTPVLHSFSEPATMDIGPKTAGEVDIDVNGKIIHVIVTRLCFPCGDSVRQVQGAELRAWALTFGEPRYIVGDFNDRVGTGNINAMGGTLYWDTYRKAKADGTATAYPDNPNGNSHGCGTLDYIWVSKSSSITIVSAEVPDVRIPPLMNPNPAVKEPAGCTDDYGVKPSDHNMVKATLRINSVTTPPPPPPPTRSPCDLNGDNSKDVLDIQLEVNQAIGRSNCTGDITGDGFCTVLDVQRVVNAALGQACVSP